MDILIPRYLAPNRRLVDGLMPPSPPAERREERRRIIERQLRYPISGRVLLPGMPAYNETLRCAGLVNGGMVNEGHALVDGGVIRTAVPVSTLVRVFNGTSDYMVTASALDLTAYGEITVTYWLWWNAFAGDNALCVEFSPNAATNNQAFWMIPNAAYNVGDPGHYGFILNGTGWQTNSEDLSITRPSAAAWHHYAVRLGYEASTFWEIQPFVDDVQVATNVNHNISGNIGTMKFGNYTLNLMARNAGASLWGAGRICNIRIYDHLLSNADIASDFAGATPAGCLHSWPVFGVQSPEPDIVGSIDLTVHGTTTTAGRPV